MNVVALAGGVGAGKLLRGLVRVTAPAGLTAVVNTADDLTIHGLHVSPDLDSVTYWLAGVADRDRGWGRAGETFRALEELRRIGGQAWFALGDLDLATHLARTQWLRDGLTLTEATARLVRSFGVEVAVLPMSDDPVRTWIETTDERGAGRWFPFQEWWVVHGGAPDVKAIRFRGAEGAAPAPGVLDAIAGADAVLICPSNPAVSIGPILAVPGVADALRARRETVVGISPIVAGAPLRGMADRVMPAAGQEVSAAGAALAYRGLLGAWVLDVRDAALVERVEREAGARTAAVDTIMVDDDAAERLARDALEALG
ncbi:MAG TPA: 2-phospho-L-lactate transferase [Actinomycetota bacterium]|nr:2-phospho-L-lactate transferase [Actinomycetota bacterium]